VAYSQSARLTVQSGRAAIKVEVNTTMRGLLAEPQHHTLCARAQEMFDMEVAVPLAPLHQIVGGKLVAALDRQHPRDLFDVHRLFARGNILDGEGRLGFMLALLSSDRPFHEVLSPTLHDQRTVMANQFAGMTEEAFSYDDFEQVRQTLSLTWEDRYPRPIDPSSGNS